MIFLVSTWNVEYPSFYFHANLVFREKTYNSQVSVPSLPVHLIHEHFQHPIYAHFFVAAMLLNQFQSPYILLVLACVLKAVAQDKEYPMKPRHHYTIILVIFC